MGTLILLRHGRSTANNDAVLAGRGAGVDLDATGAAQADGLAARLAGARVARLVSSPLLRCRRTLEPLAQSLGLPVEVDERIAEVDYGDWTGRRLADLAKEPLWRTVQLHPAAAVFPGGEALAAVSVRAVQAARDHAGAAGDDGAVVLCTHGDVIKAILADALGLHLDSFQRLVVGPASVSVVRYSPLRVFVERVNDTGSLDGVGVPPPEPAAGTEPAARGGDGRPDGAAGAGGEATVDGDAAVGGDPGRPAVAAPHPAAAAPRPAAAAPSHPAAAPSHPAAAPSHPAAVAPRPVPGREGLS